jgi:hypothetical protein
MLKSSTNPARANALVVDFQGVPEPAKIFFHQNAVTWKKSGFLIQYGRNPVHASAVR